MIISLSHVWCSNTNKLFKVGTLSTWTLGHRGVCWGAEGGRTHTRLGGNCFNLFLVFLFADFNSHIRKLFRNWVLNSVIDFSARLMENCQSFNLCWLLSYSRTTSLSQWTGEEGTVGLARGGSQGWVVMYFVSTRPPLGVEQNPAFWQNLPEFPFSTRNFHCSCLSELEWGQFDHRIHWFFNSCIYNRKAFQ